MATKWGCVGPGKISRDFFTAIKSCLLAQDHEFVAVASKDLTRAQAFAEEFNFKKAYGSYDEMAHDPHVEVVYIATLNTTHAEISIKMLEAGKHVLCEKPMTMNLKDAKRVFEAARKSTKIFIEAMWTRCFPVCDQIRKELAAGSLGDIKLVQASFCVSIMHAERIKNAKLGGGGLLDLGTYVVHLACMVFKEMPESITAVGQLSETGDVDLGGCIILKYTNGAMANLTYHTTCTDGNRTAFIMGTKGSIEIPGPFYCPTRVTTPTGNCEFPLTPGNYHYMNSAGLHYEAAAMRDTILNGKMEGGLCTLADSEMVMIIMDEVRRQIGLKYPDFD